MKKLNNKGFTIVELIVSFLFVFMLAFSMYELLFSYRTKQNEESIKAQLIDYKNQVTLAIQGDIYDKKLKNIDYCSYGTTVKDRCIILNFNDGTSKQLAIEEGTRTIDGEEYPITYIVYGDLIYESPDAPLLDFKSDYLLYNTHASDNFEEANVNVYRISIPISHNDLEGNYGISIVAVGYNYTYEDVGSDEQGGSTTAPEDLNKDDGREYNGTYITGTNYISRTKQQSQTIVARVKIDNKNHQHIFSNMQLGGSSLTVGIRDNKANGQMCYNAYLETTSKYSQIYKNICSDTEILTGTFYTVVGRFDGASNKLSIFVNGTEYPTTVRAGSFISPSTLEYGVGGNSGGPLGVNSYYLDGMVSHVVLFNQPISNSGISECLSGNINIDCLKNHTTTTGFAINNPVINEKYSKN